MMPLKLEETVTLTTFLTNWQWLSVVSSKGEEQPAHHNTQVLANQLIFYVQIKDNARQPDQTLNECEGDNES